MGCFMTVFPKRLLRVDWLSVNRRIAPRVSRWGATEGKGKEREGDASHFLSMLLKK